MNHLRNITTITFTDSQFVYKLGVGLNNFHSTDQYSELYYKKFQKLIHSIWNNILYITLRHLLAVLC